jgi:hypothetical protein
MQGSFDPYEILGVPKGATEEAIKAAYREKAKQHHPDLNHGGNSDDFVRIQEAFDWFKEHGFEPDEDRPGGPGSRGVSSASGGSSNEANENSAKDADIIQIVRSFMMEHGLEVRFDGEFVQADALQMACSPTEIDRVLGRNELDEEALVDEVVIHTRQQGITVARGLVQTAVRVIKRNDQRERLVTVMRPLFTSLSPNEQLRADAQWETFASTVFSMGTDLGIAILKKFIHQVKSKRLNRPVSRHLMPVFQSEVQGGGKTTAALKFLMPLKELHTDPALLSDLADKRSGDIYRYPVVFIDDMDQISPSLVPTLNSLVTGQGLLRRRLGSSGSRKTKQLSTLIGTCNKPISDLIPDETGNRRFATMPFRNGEPLKGGDAKVWEVVDATDFDLLWRSVDVFGEDPIEPILTELFAWQQAFLCLSPFEDWLVNLDMTSNDVQAISNQNGTKAGELYRLYVAQTSSTMSQTAFGNEMKRMANLSRGPFAAKVRLETGVFYPHRVQS